jgi:deoxyribose-phosphate aldolase
MQDTITQIKKITPNYPYDVIDHTCLNDDATQTDIDNAINVANFNHCASICIKPQWVTYVSKHTLIPITTVVGFPTGEETIEQKVQETLQSVSDGADEIDLVVNINKLKTHDYQYIEKEINEVRKACATKILKVIVESSLLSDAEIVAVTLTVEKCGADFIKTSTGTQGGATTHAVNLMRKTCPNLRIKASGGIRSVHDVNAMVSAGANRIGTSNTGRLLEETVNQNFKNSNY